MALNGIFKKFAERSISSSIKLKPVSYRNNSSFKNIQFQGNGRRLVKAGVYVSVAIGCGTFIANVTDNHIFAKAKPSHEPIRQIRTAGDTTGLKLTLYQYQTCPFCTKVRTYLDFMGISYDVIEVNSVWRTEMKWSMYKKVPVLVIDGMGKDGFIQLNDSSNIISILDSFLKKPEQSMDTLLMYFPSEELLNDKGKMIWHFPTRYNLIGGGSLRGDASDGTYDSAIKEERKWRSWTDSWLVHTLSPNIYRTPSEALDSFRYFDRVGEWDKVFTSFERSVVIYVGAAAMYLLGKHLKRKYKLDDNVRYSLYQVCDEWTRAVKKQNRKFMGGDKPNLADLSVYGALNSIEGCQAWEDAKKNTDIEQWYNATKKAVAEHKGGETLRKIQGS